MTPFLTDIPLPVYMVSLVRHRQRRQALAAALKRYGYPRPRWVRAVDGRRLSPRPPWRLGLRSRVRPWRGWADPYARRAMTLGEVGCSLSHIKVWRRIARGRYPAIVLEDDAMPVGPLTGDLPLLLEDLEHIDFELCYLAHRNAPGPKLLMGRHVHVVDYHPLWTLAYLLSPQGARRLLATPWREHLAPADELLPAAWGLNRDPDVNRVFASAGREQGLVVASHQRLFTPAFSSVASDTEKGRPVQEPEAFFTAFTVATERRPELQRLLDSGRRYGFGIQPLGLGQPWRGGDMAAGAGGGQKINLLRPALQALAPAQVVLFVDGYDTIITRHAADVLQAWRRIGEGAVVFAAEPFCWPDAELAGSYPGDETMPYRFLNSGAFMGTAGELLRILEAEINDGEDDQRYYTRCFLSKRYQMRLDYRCELFQCLNGALGDVRADTGSGTLFNHRTEQWPAVVHANGPSKSWLDDDGYAVGGRWREYYGEMT